jgi:membrane associated rhomboid family serine protease
MPRHGDDLGGTPQIAFPRLTPAVKVMLIVVVVLYVVQLIEQQWLRLGAFQTYLVLYPRLVFEGQLWRLFTWPLVQLVDLSSVIWACAGLYFFGTDLEQSYGSKRFLLLSGVMVFLAGVIATLYGKLHPVFYTSPVLGVAPFGFALTAAWGVTFPHKRLFFPPVSARVFVWILLGIAVLTILARATHESPAASIGAIAVGYLLGKYWPRIDDLLDRRRVRSKTRRDRGGLRVVQGGLADERDLKKRKPVDKRFLN